MAKNSTRDSTKKKRRDKPSKPFADFPLFAHATKRWAKKIRGKLHYFGPWSDPDAALQLFLDQKDDLYAGRIPRVSRQVSAGVTVRDLVNRFLTAKKSKQETGELAERTFRDYHEVCGHLIDYFGRHRLIIDITPNDFQQLRVHLSEGRKLVALGNQIQRIRVVFKWAFDNELIDRPVRYGSSFNKPSKTAIRRARNEQGPRMFEAKDIRALLDIASIPVRCMILLGINCGFGNNDCAKLPRSAVDLKKGWITFPRPKTAIARRCPLWSETSAAIANVLDHSPTPTDEAHAELVFITKYGKPWTNGTNHNPITKEMSKLTKTLGCYRTGVGFYALRHTFETIGGESRDQIAVDHIMGHSRDDMATVYRERVSDDRLLAVTAHVHGWLFERRERK